VVPQPTRSLGVIIPSHLLLAEWKIGLHYFLERACQSQWLLLDATHPGLDELRSKSTEGSPDVSMHL
jgi:hypothetical protein